MTYYIRKVFKSKIFLNFSYLTIGNFISQILGLIALTQITKIFSPANYGIFTFILVQAQLLSTISDLGMRNINIRTIARQHELTKQILINGIKIRFISSSILISLYYIYNNYLGSLTKQQFILLSAFTFIDCINTLFDSVLWGHRKMLIPSLINISQSIIWTLLIFFFTHDGTTIASLFFLFVIINLLKSIVLLIYIKSYHLIQGESGRLFESFKVLFKQALPYFILVLLMIPIEQISNNYLDINSTKEEIGIFNLAKRIMSPTTIIIGLALSSLFPDLSSLWANDEKKFNNLISKGFKYFILSALLLCFIFTLLAQDVIILLFSDEYIDVIKVCRLQIWFIFLMGMNSFIGTIWGAANKENLFYKTAIIHAIISTPFLYFGSKFGAYGISCGFVASASIYEIYLWSTFKKSLNIQLEHDLSYWVLAIMLFITSNMIPSSVPFLIRVFIALIITGSIIFYFIKKEKQGIYVQK